MIPMNFRSPRYVHTYSYMQNVNGRRLRVLCVIRLQRVNCTSLQKDRATAFYGLASAKEGERQRGREGNPE